jgi:RecB family endonuclease NucS
MAMREDHIRDKLAGRLALIEDELCLIGLNYPLSNSEGTRGFIDIFARDHDGVLVVVELKRSNKTSREALHEVAKYTELRNGKKELINQRLEQS